MMHISLIAVGKLKEDYLERGISEYVKRLNGYGKISVIEVAEERAPDKMSPAIEKQIQRKEGERVLSQLQEGVYVIALAIHGQTLSSEQFARQLNELAVYGRSEVAFIIGGSIGLSDEVLQRADKQLSFGRMTYPHQLMRLVLIEQIYRAFKINRGETYHK